MQAATTTAGATRRAGQTLLVYYSRSGYTHRVATELARYCQAELHRLEDKSPRQGVLGYLRSCAEGGLHVPAQIAQTPSPDKYDLVVIGTPIWCWSMSSPVRAYLARHQGELRRVAFFATCGGSGAPNAFREMEELCGMTPVATLALTDSEITGAEAKARISAFVHAVRSSVGLVDQAAPGAATAARALAHS